MSTPNFLHLVIFILSKLKYSPSYVMATQKGHLPWNPKQVWHPSHLIKEGVCVYLSMDTMHLKDPLVLFGPEDSACTLTPFLLSLTIIMLCHCSLTYTYIKYAIRYIKHIYNKTATAVQLLTCLFFVI